MRFGWLAAAAAMVCVAERAEAQTGSGLMVITQNISFTNFSGSTAYDRFDPALGKLVSAVATVSLNFYQGYQRTGDPTYKGPVDYIYGGTFSVSGLPGNPTSPFTTEVTSDYSETIIGLPIRISERYAYTAREDLSYFVGTQPNSISASFTASPATGTYPGGGVSLIPVFLPGNTLFSSLNLTYAYYLPEASTWAMMILGVGTIGGSARRRKARTTYVG